MTEPHPSPPYVVDKKLETVNPILIPQWNHWMSQLTHSTIFHTANWASVLAESYGYTPSYIFYKDQDAPRIVCPMMEVHSYLTGKRGVGLPFSDFCRPLIEPGIALIDVFNKAKTIGESKKWDSVLIRDIPEWTEKPFKCTEYLDHTIDLNKPTEELFSSLRNNYRRKIKKAKSNKLDIKKEQSIEAVKTYYQLHSLTRKKHKLPPQPFRFFKNIHKHIISQNLGFVILAYHQEKAIAGAVYMHFGKHIIYKYGGSDSAYNNLNGNFLVQWSGIEWAAENGFETLSLGRTDPENEGLIQYKDGWGSRSKPISYYKFDLKENEFVNNKSRLMQHAQRVFDKMPMPVLKIAGSILYPHIG